MLEKDIQEVLFTEEQLARRVGELAHQITQDYQGREIVLISVLRGSFVFMADLCRRIDLPCTVDFMSVSSSQYNTTARPSKPGVFSVFFSEFRMDQANVPGFAHL